MRALVIASIALAVLGGIAHAQPADVPGLLKFVETQPNDMDRSEWKEKRREAAKKLAQSKDKRAVPVLMRLAENETFDIIGEIAIEGLGTLGDPQAIPTLQKIAADNAREKNQRDLAKKSLAKLGSAEAPPDKGGGGAKEPGGTGLETSHKDGGGEPVTPPEGGSAPGNGGGSHVAPGGGLLGSGSKTSSEIPALPDLPDDTLAAYDRLTFGGGTASFGYDTVRKRLAFDADVAGLYQKRIERESMAWGVDAGAHVVTGVIKPIGTPPGGTQQLHDTRGAQLDVNVTGEARFYSGSVYGVGKAATAIQTDYVSDTDPMNANNSFHETTTLADLGVMLGGGYGRVLDVGAAIRVRRLARALDANRALGKPIDAATSRKLQLTWWALRGERSTWRALVATVAILREAGILLGEPDAGLSYEILNVLRDTQLFVRPSGIDIQVGFGESYLRRPQGLVDQNYENGRVEQLLASAGYGQQLDDDKVEIAGAAFARLRLFAGDNGGTPNPAPWALGANAHFTRFTYGEHGDPFGAFDLTGTVQLSTDDRMGTDKALLIGGEVGFTMLFNQASNLRLATHVEFDQGAIFFGGVLQATFGLLDATFAR